MQNISCIILAGGKSERLPKKPFASFRSKPLIIFMLESMEKYFDDIIISTKENQKKQMMPIVKNAKIITDKNSIFSPIEGIKSSTKEIKNEWFFLVGCDMPFASGIIEDLIKKINPDIECVIPFCERLQPLCTLYRKNVFEKADVNQSLTGFADSLKKEVVCIENKKFFLNINTEEDLKTSKDLIR